MIYHDSPIIKRLYVLRSTLQIIMTFALLFLTSNVGFAQFYGGCEDLFNKIENDKQTVYYMPDLSISTELIKPSNDISAYVFKVIMPDNTTGEVHLSFDIHRYNDFIQKNSEIRFWFDGNNESITLKGNDFSLENENGKTELFMLSFSRKKRNSKEFEMFANKRLSRVQYGHRVGTRTIAIPGRQGSTLNKLMNCLSQGLF